MSAMVGGTAQPPARIADATPTRGAMPYAILRKIRGPYRRPPASWIERGCARSRAIASTPSAGPIDSGTKA